MSKYLHKSPLSHICTNHSLRYIHSVNISRCTSNSDLAITSFGAMPPGEIRVFVIIVVERDAYLRTIPGFEELM